MINRILFFSMILSLLTLVACDKSKGDSTNVDVKTSGLKIAYVNGDSILLNFKEFRSQSEAMDEKQKKAEEELQKKGAALEREFMTYQQQAQKGTMTGKEMEARERYLSGKQETLLAERDKVAKEIMEETTEINTRLQKVLQDRLKEIKEKEGYDFILSYIAGGPILVADEKYDITEEVLKQLNETPAEETQPVDTTKQEGK
ncbi:MAG TPA: OmpH family outer membrane protein [Saprospiraceae bacterium]|nr:OmpH family outer membrane protein [Saprospiraceae bacterium]